MEEHKHSDDLFKKILENHPDFVPEQNDIEDMRRRLDEVGRVGNKNTLSWVWIAALLIPFLIGTVILFFQNKNLTQQIDLLHSKINSIEIDSTQQKHITYHFDTVYQIIYEDKIIKRQINSLGNSPAGIAGDDFLIRGGRALNYFDENFRALAFSSPTGYFSKKGNPFRFIPDDSNENSLSPGNTGDVFTSLQKYNFYQNKNQDNSELAGLKKENPASLEPVFIPSKISFLEESQNENLLFSIDQQALHVKKYRPGPIYHMTPKSFRIGVEGSPFGFIDLQGSRAFKPMFSYGIGSEIGFSDHFRMGIGIRNTYSKFETKDPAQIALYPFVPPSDPTDVIRELYVTIQHLQIPVSFKYLFENDKKFTPYLSLGMVASRSFSQKFDYKFIRTNFQEYTLNQNVNEGIFSVKNFEGAFGVEYDLSENWAANGQVFYLHDFELNAGEYFQLRNLGLNFGIKYKL